MAITMIAVSKETLAKFNEIKEMARKDGKLSDNDFVMMMLRVMYLRLRETESKIKAAEAMGGHNGT